MTTITSTEKIAYRHKPTGKWVKIYNDNIDYGYDEDYEPEYVMEYVDEATTDVFCINSKTPNKLKDLLLKSKCLATNSYYARDNFLEFELVVADISIKTEIIIKE